MMATQAAAVRGIPNRWLPVVGGVLLNMALGTLYAWSRFVPPLEQEFGWTRSQTSVVFTIGVLSLGLWFVVAGYLQDRFGPRAVAAFGGLVYSLGFFLGSQVSSLTGLYLGFAALIGVGNGFGYAVPIPVGSKWFPDKRGLVVGLMVGGYGAGSGIFGPLANTLIEQVGWRSTFRIYAGLFFAMTMVGAWLLKNPPAGYTPPGWDAAAQAKVAQSRAARDIPPGEMLRAPTFYFLWAAYCLGTAAGLMVINHLVPFGTQAGMTTAAATFGITLGAVGNAGGRILSGWVSDTFGRLNTLRLMILISAVAMPLFYMVREQALLFYLFVMVIYYCYGTQLSVFASASADFYGTKYLGTNYGLLFTAWGVSGLLGPPIGGYFYDSFGNYQYAFLTASVLSLVALGALFLAKRPEGEPTYAPATARGAVAGLSAKSK